MTQAVTVNRAAPVQVNIRIPEEQVERIDQWVEWSNARRPWPRVTRTDFIRNAIDLILNEHGFLSSLRARACDYRARLPAQPPPEFTVDTYAALARMGGTTFSRAAVCRNYLAQLISGRDEPWDIASIDRVITMIDEYSREASVPVGRP